MGNKRMVLVTRPVQQAQPWVLQLRHAGLDAHALPLIDVSAVPDTSAVQQAWLELDNFDAVMFVSSNAVEHFFALQPALINSFNQPCRTRFWVTGPGSYHALMQQSGVASERVDVPASTAEQFDSEALWDLVQSQVRPGLKVLIVRGAGVGRDWLVQQLLAAGASVTTLAAYQRTCPDFDAAQRALVHSGSQQNAVWIFSSSEAVQNLRSAFPVQQWSHASAVVTHPRIGHAAAEAGFGCVRESRPLITDVMECIDTLQ